MTMVDKGHCCRHARNGEREKGKLDREKIPDLCAI